MTNKKSVLSAIEYLSVFYLFISLNPFLLWIIWPPAINIPVFVLMTLSFLFLVGNGYTILSSKRFRFAIVVFLYAAYISLPIFTPELDIGRLISYICLVYLCFYKSDILISIYVKLRSLFFFFSIASLILFFLIVVGQEPPFIVIDGFSVVMKALNAYYKLYGVVVSSTNTIYHVGGLSIIRLCGPFLEPGHFAIYLGLLVVIDKILFNKFSYIFLVTGLLTFSPGFLFFLIIIILYDSLFLKNTKNLLVYFNISSLVLIGMLLLSKDLQNEFFELTIGRNFGGSSTDATSVLDDRAGKESLRIYDDYIKSNDVYFGKGVAYLEELGVLSDYRGIVFVYGIIGFVLCCLVISVLVLTIPCTIEMRIFILLSIILIISHRSWMMNSPFIYALLFIASLSQKYLVTLNRSEIYYENKRK